MTDFDKVEELPSRIAQRVVSRMTHIDQLRLAQDGMEEEARENAALAQLRDLAVPDNAVSIQDPSEAPEGANVVKGDRGGLYYIPVSEDEDGEDGDGDGVTQPDEVEAPLDERLVQAYVDGEIDNRDIAQLERAAGALMSEQEVFEDDDLPDEGAVLGHERLVDGRYEYKFGVFAGLEDEDTARMITSDGPLEVPLNEIYGIIPQDKLQFEPAPRGELAAEVGEDLGLPGPVDENLGPTDGIKVFDNNSLEVVSGRIEEINDREVTITTPDGNTISVGLDNIRDVDRKIGVPTPTTELQDMSVDDRLSNAFNHASMSKNAREAGIVGGNTTGDRMRILEYEDGTRDFATEVEAYNDISTGVVSGSFEARQNNIHGPRVVEAFGGGTCETAIATDSLGKEHVVKQGISGQTFRNARAINMTPEMEESFIETISAGYFAGNNDLHGANMIVDANDEVKIIDHDSGNFRYRNGKPKNPITLGPGGFEDEIQERVFEKAKAYASGEIEAPDNLPTDHRVYLSDVVDTALAFEESEPGEQ
jgi:hypothetical protein